MERVEIKANIYLLLTAIIWGTGFVAQRAGMEDVGPFIFNGLRFALGVVSLIPLLIWQARKGPSVPDESAAGKGFFFKGMIWAGLALFGGVSLQQIGLVYTTAGKAGFITGLYVVLVPLFLAVGWRAWSHWSIWIAAVLAVVGLFLLSEGTRFLALAPGDGLVLVGAVMWASHVILIGRLADRVDAVRLAVVQYLACGLLSGVVGLIVEPQTATGFASAWWAVLYTGLLSIGLGYTLQVVAQRWTPAADAAVILSGESVFAAFWGWLLLGETLTGRQLVGCGLMFTAMLLAQVPQALRARAERRRSPE